ncbi:MAG: hypothetical protein FWG29_06225 [Treponema sp.]|nr:hypothetical protein [Treponema sp.]
MKKITLTIGLLAVICVALSAQIPPNWDTNPPRDTAAHKYAVGVSQPSATEQDALKNAMQDAVRQFASSIATRFQGQTDITVQSQFRTSDIEDAYTVILETSSFSTNVPVSGVHEQARKVTNQNGRYVARVLASISTEDYNKARQYVENEEAAFLAYRFFEQRNVGLPRLDSRSKPQGFPDYYSWLRNACIIVSFDHSNQNALLEQIDLFVKKLYKNAVVFAQVIDGRGVRIIYNSGKYYDGLLRAFQNTNLFTIQRESSHLLLKPLTTTVLADLRAAVNALKDSGKFVIIGLETIQTQSGQTVNSGTIVINQFKTIASRQFNMQAVNFTVPAQYLSGSVDEDAVIRHIQNNHAAFPARYLVICYSDTRLEMGLPEYRIPPLITASCRFALFDSITGEIIHSGTAQTAPGSFTPSDLNDRTVIDQSRRALQFLYDAKTQPGLEAIIRAVFEQL